MHSAWLLALVLAAPGPHEDVLISALPEKDGAEAQESERGNEYCRRSCQSIFHKTYCQSDPEKRSAEEAERFRQLEHINAATEEGPAIALWNGNAAHSRQGHNQPNIYDRQQHLRHWPILRSYSVV